MGFYSLMCLNQWAKNLFILSFQIKIAYSIQNKSLNKSFKNMIVDFTEKKTKLGLDWPFKIKAYNRFIHYKSTNTLFVDCYIIVNLRTTGEIMWPFKIYIYFFR